MVKNKLGGNQGKKIARKNTFINKTTVISKSEEEIYGIIIRVLGGGQFEVKCNDNVNRLCLLGLGGFNENLAGGYASFEETEVFMRLNKCFNDPILFSSHNSIQHGEVPRLFASRSLLSSRYYCFTYAKNGQTCSKAKYGAILSCVFLPLVMLVNYYRIFSSKDKASFYERVILVICFTFGALRGVLN